MLKNRNKGIFRCVVKTQGLTAYLNNPLTSTYEKLNEFKTERLFMMTMYNQSP